MSLINDGDYTGKLKDAGFSVSKQGNLLLNLIFKLKENDHELIWSGSFVSENSRAYVVKTLITCGYTENDLNETVLRGRALLDLFEKEKEVKLVVQNETNEKGNTYSVIKYINDLDGFGKIMLDQADAIKQLAGYNLKADFLLAKSGRQTTAKNKKEIPTDELPF